ncbi:DUF998 domain-containing protein [Actinomadura sp. 3N407]|uniref:DUF998 domain-containing protein n=1 Tax=Actinomadura sp. 3N407 TaxID=3457423 RepID=UPI003FCDB7C4
MNSDERDGPGIVPAPVIVLTVVAALAYATFLLGSVLNPDLDFFNGYVSELSAADQPFHYVYSAGDLVTGVLTILVALGTLRKLTRRPLATAGWTFLGLFGLFAIGDAVFPLDCAPSLDTWCALRERSGHVSFSHQLHAVTSSAVIICWLAALVLLSLAASRYGWWPALARWGRRLALTQTVLAACTLTAMYMGQWLGVVQRVQICVLCLGLLVIARALYTDRRDAAHAARDVAAARERARL